MYNVARDNAFSLLLLTNALLEIPLECELVIGGLDATCITEPIINNKAIFKLLHLQAGSSSDT